jgi:hypothetical protein
MSLSEDEELELLELEEAEYQQSLASKPEEPMISDSTIQTAKDFGRGALQGGTLGFSDEIAGAFEAPLGAAKSIANKFGGEFDDSEYRAARDDSRMLDAEASERSPGAFTSGQVAGGVASAFVPGLNVAKGAKLAQTAVTAASQGGLMGLGSSTGENVGELARDASVGFGTGALGGAAGYGAGKVLEKGAQYAGKAANRVGDYLSDGAEKLYVKATGATGRESQKFAEGAGRELADRGMIKFGDTPEKIASRLQGAMDEAGGAIDSSLKGLDAQGVMANVDNVTQGLEAQIASLAKDPSQASTVRRLQGIVDDIKATKSNSVPVSEAEVTKRGFNKAAGNWMDPEAGAAAKQAYLGYMDEVERAALDANPALADKFTKAKETWGLLSPVKEAAERRAAVLNQSPFGGLLDATSIVGGGVLGAGNDDPTGGAGVGLALALARRGIAPRLASSGAVTADLLSEVAKKAPDLMGKFGPVFQGAAQRGTQAVSSTHFILENTNEEYRKLLKELRGEGSE